MRFFYGNSTDRPIRTAPDLRAYLPSDKRFQYRDGYSMAERGKLWLAGGDRPPESIVALTSMESFDAAHFEFETIVWGNGKSMTDVMVFLPGAVIAVEGKAREPFGETVGNWIFQAQSNLRSPRHRMAVVERYARALSVRPEQLLEIRYQLLHRTLSAAIAGRRAGTTHAWMIVQSFAPMNCDEHARNRSDFDRYVSLVGGAPVLEDIPIQLRWTDETQSHSGAISTLDD